MRKTKIMVGAVAAVAAAVLAGLPANAQAPKPSPTPTPTATPPSYTLGREVVTDIAVFDPEPNAEHVLKAVCPANKQPVGGGYSFDGPWQLAISLAVRTSAPESNAWRVDVITKGAQTDPPQNITATAYAVCVNS